MAAIVCTKCVIAGNAPIIDEVQLNKHILTHELRTKFEAVYAIYEADETALTQGMFAFIAFCAQFICYETTPDPIL